VIVAIDGSKFKAVNGRDRNFTKHKLKARMQQLEESIARYLADLDRGGSRSEHRHRSASEAFEGEGRDGTDADAAPQAPRRADEPNPR